MLWVSLTGLLWALTALPVAIALSRWLRVAGAASVTDPCVDGSWIDDVSQFLKEHAAHHRPPGQPTTTA